MNLRRVMQVQAKYMKDTWLSNFGGGGSVKFNCSKNCSASGKDLNTLSTSAVDKKLRTNNKSKTKSKDDYDSYN